jgi:hypothetical protein
VAAETPSSDAACVIEYVRAKLPPLSQRHHARLLQNVQTFAAGARASKGS